MYSTDLPNATESLMARKPAMPPDFLTLLAQMKVKQDTDAAQRALSMQAGQQPPTVAQQVEAQNLNNARQEIAQKMGLTALQQAAAL